VAKKIEVQIVGDADSLHRALSKVQGSTSKFGSVLGGAFKVGAVAAGGALLGLGYAAKRGIDEFNQSQAVAAQLAAVLKSTGGAANVTAKHVDKLATSLSLMSGVDDEVIGAGENLLLTFRNVRNEAGKGNDIFDQTTKATLDLSVAMGEDLHTATIQVGKALNDPIKGLTSLSRIGVTFTDKQKALITSLVDSGHAMKAQKIILGELTAEFGGSAKAAGETMAGQMNKLKNAFDEAAGSIIQKLLPYAVHLAQFAFPLVVGAIQAVATGLKRAIHWVAEMASHFQILGGKSTSAGDRIRSAWQTVTDFFRGTVMPIVRRLQGVFQQAMTQIAKVVQSHGAELQRIFSRVGQAVQAIARVALPILRQGLVVALPKAIGVTITALDHITSALQSVVSWFTVAIQKVNEFKHALDIFGGLNQGLLGKLGIDINQGLLNQTSMAGPTLGTGGFGWGDNRGPQDRRNPTVVYVMLDKKVLAQAIASDDKDYRRQNGRSRFG
jgi:hypothetical protein